MQTNQTPEALAEEARGHAVRVAIHAYNCGVDDMSDDPLRAASANNHRDVQLAEVAALEACINRLRDMAASGAKDAERLDALREHSWDVRSFDMPTGAGDADIGWKVVEHHEGKPHEREVGCVYLDDPREAIDAAIAAKKRG